MVFSFFKKKKKGPEKPVPEAAVAGDETLLQEEAEILPNAEGASTGTGDALEEAEVRPETVDVSEEADGSTETADLPEEVDGTPETADLPEEVDGSPETADVPEEEASHAEPASKGFFGRIRKGLSRTRDILNTDVDKLFSGRSGIDDDFWDELEELLITSDLGVGTSMTLIERMQKRASRISDATELKEALKDEIRQLMVPAEEPSEKKRQKPHVIMVVGVNGVGKTTTLGKIAARLSQKGEKVLIVAADTFRAAAVEQLSIWADRAGCDMVKHKENSDPSAVTYDGIEAAMARGADVVLVDTAGRLHNKKHLMDELKKIRRTIAKKLPGAPHETLMVVDATTGQNALTQARLFHEEIGVTGLALTKLDGTAKGGIVVSITDSLKLPLQYIGVGEQLEDLQVFDPESFVNALF